MKTFLNALLLIIYCLCSSLVWGADSQLPEENIHIKADTMNQGEPEGVITAIGNVVITTQGMKLVSDRANYNSQTKLLHATGNVVVIKGIDVIRGESFTLNLENNRSEMDNAVLSVAATNLTLAGDKITRISENKFECSNSKFTTCDWPDSSWKFGSSKLKVDMDGYATGRNVIFYIKDVPVLYIPWIAYPVVRGKKSGILYPRLSFSNTRGNQIVIPAYLVISESQDLQLDLDLSSKRGIGTGLNYRYIRARGSEGFIGGYQIFDQDQKRMRWQIAQSHKEIFSPDMNLRVDVNLNSDSTFLSDFSVNTGDYNRQSNETTFNALKTWQHYALTTHLRYIQDLYAGTNSRTLQTLPEIGVAGVRQQIGKMPLYFDVDTSMSNFYRESLPSGQRLHLFPRVTFLKSQNKFFNTSLFTGAHIRAYNTDNRIAGSGVHKNDGDLLPEVGARLSTSFSRIYQIEGASLKKLRHEMVPEISYSFIPDRNQERLPLYDYTDRLVWQNMVNLSLTNMLDGKFATGKSSEYRDLSRVKLLLGYSFDGTRRDLLAPVESKRPWTNLTLETDTWVHKFARLNMDAGYNLYDRRIDSTAAGIEFDDRRGNTLGTGYRMIHNDGKYLEGRVSTRWIKPLTLSYTSRYSFDRGDFLEKVYSVTYSHKCWSLNLAMNDRPGNRSITFSFNLTGITGFGFTY